MTEWWRKEFAPGMKNKDIFPDAHRYNIAEDDDYAPTMEEVNDFISEQMMIRQHFARMREKEDPQRELTHLTNRLNQFMENQSSERLNEQNN
jgi:hypothetical protein